ncbi:MAG: hypothetical protein KatS3mg077_2343 [Candidatus Binatia bacterium]|nr:MAG: hypothetical protein KatS3mg077_2343 [Candidatus Binatia bacterium]
MAQLTAAEFREAVFLLARELGAQRLRDRLVQVGALVTRRGKADPDRLAEQLYLLSGGLRRQVPATIGFFAIWNNTLHQKLGEEGEERLEKLAEKVNACLDERDTIIPDKEAELEPALLEYEAALRASVGAELAYFDMLLKAVPAVAERLRARRAATLSAGRSEGEGPSPSP